ncbi:tRNA intron catalytic C-terminal domain-containing protein [Cryptosporidium ubiquitum]|uniref:tRNA-intron lyase n=1 Tax=Cryptosporidium ubiquitum TaxID=857276 RepID=A0A1J4MMU3_9CRYT|nr:tRNA intron catalytic C-terminal domain-containing protein [Cryptosporidium ubiquitum]OII75561.1 tRNA intron catalytic C-terminal domain-containing protein [Cryptosporidium ubiquitum]
MDINNVAELSVDFKEFIELKKKKILLNPIGTLPRYSQQNIDLGLPIAIMDYQYDLIKNYRQEKSTNINQYQNCDLKQNQVQKTNFLPNKCIYPENFSNKDNIYKQVYYDLVVKYGYYVQQGSKYGCDFVLYENDPDTCHSSFLLNIIDPHKKQILTVRDLVLWQRVSNKVNKKAVIAILIEKDPEFNFTTQNKEQKSNREIEIKYFCLDSYINDLKIIK